MPLASCARCKKMFNKTDSEICPACLPEETADREKIRNVLDTNVGLNAQEVADKAEVEVAVVQRMLKEGMVITSSGLDVSCGRCGEPAISISKRLCQKCLDKLNAEMARAQAEILKTARSATSIRENVEQKRS